MTKKEVIERFCALAGKVGIAAFDNTKASDCFCDERNLFQFDDEVIEFIEAAVEEKLAKS